MKKVVVASLGAIALAACSGVTLQTVLDEVAKNAKQYCGVAVNLTDLAVALSGQNPSAIVASQLAHSICDQYLAKVQNVLPQAQVGENCQPVLVNNQPVRVCK
jgi:hypothetical protein